MRTTRLNAHLEIMVRTPTEMCNPRHDALVHARPVTTARWQLFSQSCAPWAPTAPEAALSRLAAQQVHLDPSKVCRMSISAKRAKLGHSAQSDLKPRRSVRQARMRRSMALPLAPCVALVITKTHSSKQAARSARPAMLARWDQPRQPLARRGSMQVPLG